MIKRTLSACSSALLAALLLGAGASSESCPNRDRGEHEEDCPWAGAARMLGDTANHIVRKTNVEMFASLANGGQQLRGRQIAAKAIVLVQSVHRHVIRSGPGRFS